jgi:UDP-N-acetylglucosamine--dolichyl-phosphate N-acetylglucosaminephosphotransferase
MLLLGFVDDVLDIPWRVKLVLPCIAALPLLIAYSGGTGEYMARKRFSLLSTLA